MTANRLIIYHAWTGFDPQHHINQARKQTPIQALWKRQENHKFKVFLSYIELYMKPVWGVVVTENFPHKIVRTITLKPYSQIPRIKGQDTITSKGHQKSVHF